jgi:hypothetical protein
MQTAATVEVNEILVDSTTEQIAENAWFTAFDEPVTIQSSDDATLEIVFNQEPSY